VSAPARAPHPRRSAPPARRSAPTTRSRPYGSAGGAAGAAARGATRSSATGWSRTRLVTSKGPQPATRTGPRRAPFVLLIAGLLVGGLCALLALNTAAAAQELRRQSLTQSNADSSDDVQQLKAELAAKQAPDTLGRAAAALGMVPANHPAFLRVLPDGTVKVMGSPQPATPAPVPTPSAPTPHNTATSTTPAKKPTGHTTPATKPTTAAHSTKPPAKPTQPATRTGGHQ